MRANDPNLQFALLSRLEWDKYFISVGDRNIVISCKLPYPKWTDSKNSILLMTELIARAEIAQRVERYSLKYVNLIAAPTLAAQIEKIKMSITLGSIMVNDDHVNMQVHRVEDDTINILSVITGAQGKLYDGKERFGVVVAIDSIRKLYDGKERFGVVVAIDSIHVQLPAYAAFASTLEPGLEQLKQANEANFYDCLADGTIEAMEPVYD